MLRVGHQYSKDVTALLQQNHQKSAYCHVQRHDRDNSEFEVQEISTPINIGQNQSHALSD